MKIMNRIESDRAGTIVEASLEIGRAIEAGTPNVLFRRGFTKASLLPGTQIVVDGYQAKDGSRRANGRDVTFPDGRTLFLGSPGTVASDELRQDAR